MWFAALSDYRNTPWFRSFMARLLHGSPEVMGLLGKNPFPEGPPKYVRAVTVRLFVHGQGERSAWWTPNATREHFPRRRLRRRRSAAVVRLFGICRFCHGEIVREWETYNSGIPNNRMNRCNRTTKQRTCAVCLLDDKKPCFYAIVRDPIPHHSGLAAGDHVFEIHYLAGVQRGISVDGAKAAFAVIQQAAGDFLAGGIIEGELQMLRRPRWRRSERRSAAVIIEFCGSS